jgi:hypothetical protein
VAIQLFQFDDDLWVNPSEIVAVYSDGETTFISTALNEFEVPDQSVTEVIERLANYVTLFYEEDE